MISYIKSTINLNAYNYEKSSDVCSRSFVNFNPEPATNLAFEQNVRNLFPSQTNREIES